MMAAVPGLVTKLHHTAKLGVFEGNLQIITSSEAPKKWIPGQSCYNNNHNRNMAARNHSFN